MTRIGPAPVVKIEAPDDRYLPGYKQGLKSIGPRLIETRVAFSLYGTAIPLSFGTRPIGGNVLWSKPLTEIPVVENQSTRYTYYGTFAVSFGYAGNADASKRQLLRVWADGRLILDNRANGRAVARSFRYRWYDGSETQEPDPTILEDKGADNTPAFRGQMYMVITDLPLWAFDNKIPYIQVEVGDVDATSNLVTAITATGEGSNRNRVHVNWQTKKAYVVNIGLSPTGVYRYNLDDDTFMGGIKYNVPGVPQSHFTGVFVDTGIDPVVHEYMPWANAFLAVPDDNAWTNNTPMIIDADTGNVITYIQDGVPQPFMFRAGQMALPRVYTVAVAISASGGKLTFLGYDGFNLTKGYEFGSGYDNNTVAFFGKATTSDIQFFAAVSTSNVVQRMIITDATTSSDTAPVFDATWLPYDGVGVGVTVKAGVYCPTYNAILVIYSSGEARLVDVDTGSNIWRLTGLPQTPSTNDGTGCLQNGDQTNSLVTYVVSNTVVEIDLAKGTFRTFALTSNLIGSNTATFDSASLMVVGKGTADDKVRKIKYEYAAASEISIGDLITQMALRNGYDIADIQIDAGVTATVNGAVFTEATSLAELNEIVKTLYGYDIRESAGKLIVSDTFNTYTTPAFTFDQDDLIDSDNPFSERREPDTPVPRTVTVTYLDPTLGYEWASQTFSRDRDEFIHDSEGTNELKVPFIMTAQKAKEAAFRMAYAGVISKEGYSFRLGQEFLEMEPGDVLSATINGHAYLIRPIEVNYETDFTLSIEGERFQVYEPINIDAFGGYPYTGEVKRDFSSLMFTFGVPYLSQQDIPIENFGVFYYVISPGELTTTFTGVYGSLGVELAGIVTWRKLQFSDFAVPVGVLTRSFGEPDIGCEHAVDFKNTINMFINSGDPDLLSSVTYDDLFNGANLAIVGSPNRWEVIRWQNIAIEADGSYTVSNIMRGCFNTERNARNLNFDAALRLIQYAGSGVAGPPEREFRRPKFLNASKAGDYFIPIDDAWLKKEVLDVEDSGTTFKTIAANSTDGLLGYHAVDLYESEVSPAPTDIRVERNANGFLTVKWSPVFKHFLPAFVDGDTYGSAIRNEMTHYAIYVWVPPYIATGAFQKLEESLLLEWDQFVALYEAATTTALKADKYMEGEFNGKQSLTTNVQMSNKPPLRLSSGSYGPFNAATALYNSNMPFVYMATTVLTSENGEASFTFPYHCPVVDAAQTGAPVYPAADIPVGSLAGVPSTGMKQMLAYPYVFVGIKRLMRSSPKQAAIGTDLRPHPPLKVGYTGAGGNPSSYTSMYAGLNDNTTLKTPGVFYTSIVTSDLDQYNDVRGGNIKWVKALVKDV